MTKTLLVLRNELITTITRKSFLFTAIGLPLIGFLVFTGATTLGSRAAGADGGSGDDSAITEIKAEGFVDLSGLVQSVPEDIPPDTLLAYPNEERAQAALQSGEITAYYIVPSDYVESGEFTYVHPEANPISESGQDWVMRWTLLVNMLEGDVKRAGLVWNPMDLQETTLAATPQRDADNMATFFVPYAVTMIFYFIILFSSSLLLNSVNDERKNRVIEILLQSITPRQMLTGKIAGLGIASLVQSIIWIGTGYSLLRLGGRTLNLPPGLVLPFSFIMWGILFFLLGYAVYASLMASLGALVPNLREATQATFVIIAPLIVPLFFVGVLIENPNGPLAVALSLFPLSAPVTMMTRLAAGSVPLWQPVLSAVLLALTAWVIVRAVARMFHAQILLSGQPFNVGRFFSALLGRA